MPGSKNALLTNRHSWFFYSILFVCLVYAVYEWLYIPYWILSADEFVTAKQIFEYTNSLPYRDFPPYKATLGYYFLSIPLFFSHSVIAPLFYIKYQVALVNTLFIGLAAFWTSRLFDEKAVLLALLAVISNQFFITAQNYALICYLVGSVFLRPCVLLKGVIDLQEF